MPPAIPPTGEFDDSPEKSRDLHSSPQHSSPQRSSPQRSSPQRSSPQRSSPQRSSPQRSSPQRSLSAPSPAQAKHERIRQRALRDLKSLRYEGGGFGAGWTQSALVRSLLRTDKEATDITPRLRRVIIILRVVSFVAMSLWVIYYLANS